MAQEIEIGAPQPAVHPQAFQDAVRAGIGMTGQLVLLKWLVLGFFAGAVVATILGAAWILWPVALLGLITGLVRGGLLVLRASKALPAA